MARKKHTVALFDVIHKDKRYERKPETPLNLDLPRWWKRAKSAPPPTSSSIPQPKAVVPPFITLLRRFVLRCRIFAHRAMRGLRSFLKRLEPIARRQAAPLCGGGAAVLLIAGLEIARHLHGAAAASTLEALRTGPAHPSVLQVTRSTTYDQARPAASTLIASTRQAGMYYVEIQAYDDVTTARQAADFLNQNNVPATVERGDKPYENGFFKVIGLQGFTQHSGTRYLAYRDKIKKLSKQFAPDGGFRAFSPEPVKWEAGN